MSAIFTTHSVYVGTGQKEFELTDLFTSVYEKIMKFILGIYQVTHVHISCVHY